MTDSGKHSALRQTSDGSFEIVFDREGLQEVSEEELSAAEATAPEPREPVQRTSPRVLVVGVVAVVALLAVGAVGWFALSGNRTESRDVDEVPGFRPYGGGGVETGAAATQRPAVKRPVLPVEPEEVEPTEVVEEITESESEAGWELNEGVEAEVVVEVEGTEAAAELPLEQEVAETPPDAVARAEEEHENRVRVFSGRDALKSLRATDVGRTLQPPRVPAFNGNPLAAERMKSLPIRNIQADSVAVDEGEIVDEPVEEVEGEVIDEEVVDEDVEDVAEE